MENIIGSEFNERFLKELVAKGKLSPKLYEKMMEQDFLSVPASTKYHGSYKGGLFEHCYNMYLWLEKFTNRMQLKWDRPESVGNVAFGHDWCKVDSYIFVPDKREDDHLIPSHFDYNKNSSLHGHGMKSVILLQQFMELTEQEMYCILYHMGAYETDQWEAYGKAIQKYPHVLYTHTADMYASKVVGV